MKIKSNPSFASVLLIYVLLVTGGGCDSSSKPESPSQPAAETSSTTPAPQATEPKEPTTAPAQTAAQDINQSGPNGQAVPSEPQQTSVMTDAAPASSSETKPAANQDNGRETMLALAQKSGCLACHAIDRKIVGPAWQDVAKRYHGDAGAKSTLVAKVKKGGNGVWNEITNGAKMPPYSPRVKDEDIEALVGFVLSL